jgi:signal-transduction protein with cAMP-binding, CBS, and nucleotidyltransferase domain
MLSASSRIEICACVVAEGLSVTTPVKKVMSFLVLKVSAHDLCFEAVLEMMNQHVHYSAV